MARIFVLVFAIGLVITTPHVNARAEAVLPSADCPNAFTRLFRMSREFLEFSNKIVASNDFNWKRGLEMYFDSMYGFRNRFNELPRGAVWIDLGAGGAFAMQEGIALKSAGYIDMYAFGVKIPEGEEGRILSMKQNGGFEYHEGKLEDIDLAVVPKADIITDLYGVVSYSPNLELVLQKSLGQLKEGGEMYVMVGQGAFTFKKGFFSSEGLAEFAHRIKGVEVVDAGQETENQGAQTLRFRRTSGPIVIPEIELVKVRGSRPPFWTYRFKVPPK